MTTPAPLAPLLLRAIRGEAIERPPVWAMRQAGRWDPEFNRLRGKLSFYEFSENAELAAQASLLPLRFGVDAIILFYDITTLAVAMGLPFQLQPNHGPMPHRPVRTVADVEGLAAEPELGDFAHVLRLLQLVQDQLAGRLPVLVFAGAPFTLGSYCIGTGKDLSATRRFAAESPAVWDGLLEKMGNATVHFLRALAREGADAYQLFDSWAGDLEDAEYRAWAQPHHEAIFRAVRLIPSILFVKECPRLDLMVQSGADVVSLGTRHDLAAARQRFPEQAFQGNVDADLLRSGSPDEIAAAARRCVAQGGRRRHVINLSHGVHRTTPVANFEAYVQAARGEMWRS
jgi:uroporphyrinogen decarboxylase